MAPLKWISFIAAGLCAQLADARLDAVLTIQASPEVRFTGVDLPHNAYYALAIPAQGADRTAALAQKTLMKYDFKAPGKEVWKSNYVATAVEFLRPSKVGFDSSGNIFHVTRSKQSDNTIHLRKFSPVNGTMLFSKDFTPCVNYDPDFTLVDFASLNDDLFALAVACEFRELGNSSHKVEVYGLDGEGTVLWDKPDMPGRFFLRLRTDPTLMSFGVSAMGVTDAGDYEGVWDAIIDGKTGVYGKEPYILAATPGSPDTNAGEVAVQSILDQGLGSSDSNEVSLQDTASFLSDLHGAKGKSARFVIGRKPLEDGPTYLLAQDLKTGKLLEITQAGDNLPASLSVEEDRVAVLMYGNDALDLLSVFNYTPAGSAVHGA